jgi:hypothetical protein
MTDQTNNAATDLAIPGAEPSTPAAPQMSVAEAASRKNEFMADKAKVDALFAGDVSATEEWRNIVNAISAQPVATTGREAVADDINAASGYSLSPEVLDQVRNNTPITPEERRWTLALWEEKKQDPDFIARLNRGEMKARKEMALININLASPVRDPNPS